MLRVTPKNIAINALTVNMIITLVVMITSPLRYLFPPDHINKLMFMIVIMIIFMIVMALVGIKPDSKQMIFPFRLFSL